MKISKTSYILLTIILLISISIVSCSTTKTVIETEQIQKIDLRLEWFHHAQFAGFYAAKDKGFYAEENLEVNFEQGGTGLAPIPLVISGSEQFGLAEADQILLAREQGIPVVPLVTIYRKSPLVWFSLASSNITEPKDFEGKKVGSWPDTEALFETLMKKAGVDESKVEQVPVKYDVTPILTGQVDVFPGFIIYEPIVVQEKGYDVNLIWPSDYGINFYSMTLFTSEKLLKEQPELVDKFVIATLEGWDYTFVNPSEIANVTVHYSDELEYDFEYKKRCLY